MPIPTHRSPRSEPSDPNVLTTLASHIDEAFCDLSPGEPAHLVRLVRKANANEQIELGVLPLELGIHPADAMAGFTAPAEWSAFGVVTTGRSSELDTAEPGPCGRRPAEPIRLTFVLDRSGAAITFLTAIGSGQRKRRVLREPPVGLIADSCRRVLGLPTAPPAEGPGRWIAARWLDRLLAAAIEQPCAVRTWEAATRLHPLVSGEAAPTPEALGGLVEQAVSQFDWEQLRLLATQSRAKEPVVPPLVAAWMDAGCFARHVLATELPMALMLTELEALLPASVMSAVRSTLQISGAEPS